MPERVPFAVAAASESAIRLPQRERQSVAASDDGSAALLRQCSEWFQRTDIRGAAAERRSPRLRDVSNSLTKGEKASACEWPTRVRLHHAASRFRSGAMARRARQPRELAQRPLHPRYGDMEASGRALDVLPEEFSNV